jgi:hypothetical protein
MRCVARIDRETGGEGGYILHLTLACLAFLERLLVVTCVYIWEEQRCFALLCFAARLALRRCVRASSGARGVAESLK